ncbi:hypothetical protein [Candidatus Enterococcus clewellii]|uniref:Uncharacterized protein n=1 Tax=Candidatus Enterococcus clewellii TaxID=1834193 RepID=A0A242JWU9_9ENTE|nr:hypothetical protein [Enterococcus sp. 9E7_DIV0242]OTP09690.1 hypothetical protein A5888_004149 [Enterococcus sp. 9E7_DIV0242]
MNKPLSISTLSFASWVTISLYVYLQGRSVGKINYFLLLQLFIGMLLIFLPIMIQTFLHVSFPDILSAFYQLFLILSIFLGTGLNFVNKIPHWDKGLHVLCGIFFSLLGYSIFTLFLDTTSPHSFWPYVLFGFCFSLTIGLLWEFWEFFCDCFFGMNLQQFNGIQKIPKIGQAALMDTMLDLLADFFGALLVVINTLIQCTHTKNYFVHFMLQR